MLGVLSVIYVGVSHLASDLSRRLPLSELIGDWGLVPRDCIVILGPGMRF
jgi:hypothetical protein